MTWIMKINGNPKATLASTGSLSFVAITLLMEYKLKSDWVHQEDWRALLDAVT